MDRIINYLLLVIIFVFDPLAIALVIAANFAFSQLTKREEIPLEEKVEDMRRVVNSYDDLDKETKEWLEADLGESDILEEEEKQYEIYKEQDQKFQESEKQEEEDWVIVDEDDEREKEVEAAIDKIEALTNDISSPEHFKKEAAMEEIKKLKKFLKANNKDNTITYF